MSSLAGTLVYHEVFLPNKIPLTEPVGTAQWVEKTKSRYLNPVRDDLSVEIKDEIAS